MITRVLVVVALVALLAGCAGSHQAAPPPVKPKPKPQPRPKPTHGKARHHSHLTVTILDGDRRVRVRGAQVSLLGRSGRTDRHGVIVGTWKWEGNS